MSFNKQDLKNAIIAILVGALVSFLSSFFDGIIGLLQGWGNDVAGGVASTSVYLAKTWRV